MTAFTVMLSLFLALLLACLVSPSSATSRPTRNDVFRSFPSSHAARFASVLTSTATPPPQPRSTATYQRQLPLPLPAAYNVASPQYAPTSFVPIDFGADPTGVNDSTAAFASLLMTLFAQPHPHPLADGMTDLGGVVIDLSGGDYLISKPIVIPPLYGNIFIQRGTLRASKSFPADRYLIEIGNSSTPTVSQGCTNENVGVNMVMTDASLVAAGGIIVWHTMGAVLNNNFHLGFLVAGINVQGGHEVQIDHNWLGEYLYSDPRKERGKATGILINGNDHVISNVVVFSGLIGVYMRGAANLIFNVHTWNDATGNGGTGMVMDCAGYTQNRIVASYLDFTDLVIIDPEHMLVTDGFFLGGASIILRASKANHQINGLVIRDNEFDYSENPPTGIIVDESIVSFSALIDTFIDGNMFSAGWLNSGTKAVSNEKVLFNLNSTICFDLTKKILFKQFIFTNIQVSVQFIGLTGIYTPNNFIYYVTDGRAPSVPPGDIRTFCVEIHNIDSGKYQSANVFIEVDQSAYSTQQSKNQKFVAKA